MSECNILWSGKYHQNWENDLHSHGWFQMIGILSGCGTVIIDENRYNISKEKIFLIGPHQMHAIHCDPNSTAQLKMLDVKFSVSDHSLFEDLLKVGECFTLNDFGWFSLYFDKIIEESILKEPHYYKLISTYLYTILVRIIRERLQVQVAPAAELELSTVHSFKGVNIDQLLQYINFNYSNIISLDDLSVLAKVNKTTLISIFKELYATTPIRYINRIRLQKAKELLVNTDTSIGEIADLIGFQSIHYFSRYFKSKENCTPIEYRMRNTQSKFFTY